MRREPFCSQYVINGVPGELTPAEILDAVCEKPCLCQEAAPVIVDEVEEPNPQPCPFDASRQESYFSLVTDSRKKFSFAFAGTCTRSAVASCLLDMLWRKGNFRLGDLCVDAMWKWTLSPVGAAAAFYESVQGIADYLDSLGLKIGSYSFEDSPRCDLELKAALSGDALQDDADIFVREAFRSKNPVIEDARACPGVFVPDPQSWIIYIPFETSEFRLGGSLLAQSLAVGGGVTPSFSDPDYFMDCYEVLRELVEDGIVLSGATVGDGGMIRAASGMCSPLAGFPMDITDIMSAYQEKDSVRILFSEVPGVLIQIRDMDFDYLDAELLLQDVAYYPLGHPDMSGKGVSVRYGAKSGIQTILESLLQNAEGED